MIFEILTIFPDFFRGPLDYGIVRRARESGLIEVRIHDLRGFTRDRHRTVDDRPFGGGEGMVLKPEPIFECIESLGMAPWETASGEKAPADIATDHEHARESVALLSAGGRLFTQEVASELSGLRRLALICGRYEGVDERVAEELADRELSVGDFVLSGGELGAALIVDAITRLLPGALGNEQSARQESFTEWPAASGEVLKAGTEEDATGRGPEVPLSTCPSGGLLDYPHYTRPAEFRGAAVPEVLLSGNHDQIRRWRRRRALEKTLRNRPDLLTKMDLSEQDKSLLEEIRSGKKQREEAKKR